MSNAAAEMIAIGLTDVGSGFVLGLGTVAVAMVIVAVIKRW